MMHITMKHFFCTNILKIPDFIGEKPLAEK